MQCQLIVAQAVSRLSRHRDRGSISGKYAWDLWWTQEAPGQVFSMYFEPPHVSIIPPVLNADHLSAVITRRTNG